MQSKKEFFITRYKQLGWKYVSITVPQFIRINTLIKNNCIIDALQKRGVKFTPVSWLDNAYRIDYSPFSLGSTTEYLLGYYYLQSAAAQLPACILNPQHDTLVLDCCASPGGKLTQLAALMNNTGVIIGLEKKKERINRLANNLERLRVVNSIVYLKDAKNSDELGIVFDSVLADVPCSGNFTQEKNWFSKRTLEDIKTMSGVQKEILKATLNALKPDGILVYSTCSLEPEENELVIEYAITALGACVLPIDMPVGVPGLTCVFDKNLHPSIQHTRRIWPGETEGFFIAKLTRP